MSTTRWFVGGWSGNGRRCFGCAGPCSATPSIVVGRIGAPAVNAPPIRKDCGTGWLSRKGIEAAAKGHIEASGWMRDHLTKAVGLHVADEVWETVDRHLFADSSGRRHGAPRIGSWREFTRIPGRARSHTKTTPVWETWRLVGTLDGHLQAYRHPEMPASVSKAAAAAARPAGTSILAQPARLAAPLRPASGRWTDHTGALVVVFTGLPGGDVVLPVRLPQGAGQWAHLAHFLADPEVWHKIDLVRVRDRKAPGGWRYYAHLLIHQAGYQAPATRSRRTEIPAGRCAGVDANVSNLALASFPGEHPEQLALEQISCDAAQQQAAARAGTRARVRQRAMDRSRRNTNAGQYGPSQRQRERAARRATAGLPPKQVTNPRGPRAAHTDGVPLRGYRHDRLSRSYRRIRADHATEARRASQAKRTRARRSRRGSFPPTATPSPSRTVRFPPGRACGGLLCLAPACWWPRSNANAKPPAACCLVPAPDPPRCPSIACAGRGCRNPSPSAPMTAHTAGYTVTVTSSRAQPKTTSPQADWRCVTHHRSTLTPG